MKFLTHLRQPRGLYWIALGVVVLVQVGIVWLLPILPAQDLPQHLAYARILRDHRVPNLPFGEVYEPVAGFQPYFMFHYALAGMGRVGGIDWACRVLFSLYIVTLTLALNRLSRAVSAGNGREPRWSTFLAPLATWSPIACMGFVPFLFAIPALLMGCASVATASEVPTVRHGIIAALWAAVVVSLHPVAAGCLIVYAGCYWGGKRTRKSLVVVCTVLGSVLVAQIAWGLVSDHGLGTFANVEWSEPRKRALGLDFITEAFKIRWPDPFLNLSYCLWTAFGPYRATGQITVAGAILIAAIISWRCRGRSSAEPASEGTNSAAVQAALAFFAIAWLAPWGFFLPSEITFLNLRLISLSGAIALASLSGKLFVSTASKVAAWGLAMFVALHFGLRAQKFNAEASVALGLLDEARPPGKMLPIVFHNTSAQFGKQFALTHFLPMYYLINDDGISLQFWGRYTHHLPVRHRSGRAASDLPDWQPWHFKADHLVGADYVLLQRATEDDSLERRNAAARVEGILERRLQHPRCEGLWCLFRARRKAGQSESTGDGDGKF